MKNTTYTELRIPGNEVMVGDLYRFRMSRYDPVRWLRVLVVTPFCSTNSVGKTVTLHLEACCMDHCSIGDKRGWATVRREVAK